MAILLDEENLLERSLIYATDINVHALETAQAGVYPLDHIGSYTANHRASGGKSSLSDHYTAAYGHAQFPERSQRHMGFSAPSPATAPTPDRASPPPCATPSWSRHTPSPPPTPAPRSSAAWPASPSPARPTASVLPHRAPTEGATVALPGDTSHHSRSPLALPPPLA